jgi:hypothetical protein
LLFPARSQPLVHCGDVSAKSRLETRSLRGYGRKWLRGSRDSRRVEGKEISMRGIARVAALIAGFLAVGLVGAQSAWAAKPDTVPGLPVQLALGDSWAAGFGATPPETEGYVPQLHEVLKRDYNCSPAASPNAKGGCKHLQLVSVAVPGATTPTLIANQLPQASEILRARNLDSNPPTTSR